VITFDEYCNQDYGFDEKRYMYWQLHYPCIALDDGYMHFVPYKSVGARDDDTVIAKTTPTGNITSPSFKYADGI